MLPLLSKNSKFKEILILKVPILRILIPNSKNCSTEYRGKKGRRVTFFHLLLLDSFINQYPILVSRSFARCARVIRILSGRDFLSYSFDKFKIKNVVPKRISRSERVESITLALFLSNIVALRLTCNYKLVNPFITCGSNT